MTYMYKAYKKGRFVGDIEEIFDIESEEPVVTETDEAIAELGILAAENAERLEEALAILEEYSARFDEQDAALVELAALLAGE